MINRRKFFKASAFYLISGVLMITSIFNINSNKSLPKKNKVFFKKNGSKVWILRKDDI